MDGFDRDCPERRIFLSLLVVLVAKGRDRQQRINAQNREENDRDKTKWGAKRLASRISHHSLRVVTLHVETLL
jgi:hypothetical protein